MNNPRYKHVAAISRKIAQCALLRIPAHKRKALGARGEAYIMRREYRAAIALYR